MGSKNKGKEKVVEEKLTAIDKKILDSGGKLFELPPEVRLIIYSFLAGKDIANLLKASLCFHTDGCLCEATGKQVTRSKNKIKKLTTNLKPIYGLFSAETNAEKEYREKLTDLQLIVYNTNLSSENQTHLEEQLDNKRTELVTVQQTAWRNFSITWTGSSLYLAGLFSFGTLLTAIICIGIFSAASGEFIFTKNIPEKYCKTTLTTQEELFACEEFPADTLFYLNLSGYMLGIGLGSIAKSACWAMEYFVKFPGDLPSLRDAHQWTSARIQTLLWKITVAGFRIFDLTTIPAGVVLALRSSDAFTLDSNQFIQSGTPSEDHPIAVDVAAYNKTYNDSLHERLLFFVPSIAFLTFALLFLIPTALQLIAVIYENRSSIYTPFRRARDILNSGITLFRSNANPASARLLNNGDIEMDTSESLEF